jgi:hypothetical protein
LPKIISLHHVQQARNPLRNLQPFQSCKKRNLPKNNSSTAPTIGKQALKKPSSAISKQQEKEIVVNKTFKRPTRKLFKRNTKENR